GKLVSGVREQISLVDLSGKVIAIDAYNTIYQFLSIIRQPDGSPLVDSRNRVTSHLSGLLYRTINLLDAGVIPVFVFDGMPPLLKRRTLEARANRRENALKEWERARREGQVEEARTHAMASTKINKEIVGSSKELLMHMGIPFMQAPSEGEAQGAVLVRDGLAYASASQDYDSFLFGADVVIRNLTISGRRKLPMKNVWIEVKTERIMLKNLLDSLEIDRLQLIHLGMLIGTDFNSGIARVGPKTALKIVKEHRSLDDINTYLKSKYGTEFDSDPKEVEGIFTNPETNHASASEFNSMIKDAVPDKDSIIRFMCSEHGFSEERVAKVADRLLELRGQKGQRGINNWM
ncbi:MAG: flap endonuclease-1, partial [Candidatus Marsarchaeota archaeon]|nr:flap endonuclease-1 [Candidatus Marsarchaeota archaeon]